MAVQIGNFIPGFNFALQPSLISPKILSSSSSGILTGQVIDSNQTIVTFSGVVTGSQFNVQIVPQQYVLFGQNPTVTLTSNNTGIANIDLLGNTTYNGTGFFNIIGIYPKGDYYEAFSTYTSLINNSGGGSVATTTTYIPDIINVSKHILVVYNTGSNNSTNLKTYYTGHRPQFSTANVLGIGCVSGNESVSYSNYISTIQTPIVNYLTGISGSKPIRYIVMMSDIPTRVSNTNVSSVSYQLSDSYHQLGIRNGLNYQGQNNHFSLGQFQQHTALISYINFGIHQDNIAYIDKISNGQNGIYLSGNGLNTGYYIEDVNELYPTIAPNFNSGRFVRAILGEFSSAKIDYRNQTGSYIVTGNNLAGFCTWGSNGGRGGNYANDGSIKWGHNNNWYLINTIESFNGQRSVGQGNFIDWFSSGAFGGTGYENCPIAASCNVDEPGLGGTPNTGYFVLWQRGWPFIECSWQSRNTPYFMACGDPLIVK